MVRTTPVVMRAIGPSKAERKRKRDAAKAKSDACPCKTWTTWQEALATKLSDDPVAFMYRKRPDLFDAWLEHLHKETYRVAITRQIAIEVAEAAVEADSTPASLAVLAAAKDAFDTWIRERQETCYAHWKACPNSSHEDCDCYADRCTCLYDLDTLAYYRAHPEALDG